MSENINKSPTDKKPRRQRMTSAAKGIASLLTPRTSRIPQKEATVPPDEQSIEQALLEDIHDAQTRSESDRPIVAEFNELVKLRDAVLAQQERYGRLGRSKIVKDNGSAMLWRDTVNISRLPKEFKVLGSRARDPLDEDLYVSDLGGSPVHGGTVEFLTVTRETSSDRAKNPTGIIGETEDIVTIDCHSSLPDGRRIWDVVELGWQEDYQKFVPVQEATSRISGDSTAANDVTTAPALAMSPEEVTAMVDKVITARMELATQGASPQAPSAS